MFFFLNTLWNLAFVNTSIFLNFSFFFAVFLLWKIIPLSNASVILSLLIGICGESEKY